MIVGAIAGLLAGLVVKGSGFGLIGDIIVGIIGAVIAGWLSPRLGIYIGGGIISQIIAAFIGAVIPSDHSATHQALAATSCARLHRPQWSDGREGGGAMRHLAR